VCVCICVLQAILFYRDLSVANVVEASLHRKATSESIFPLHFVLLYYIGEANNANLHCLSKPSGNIFLNTMEPMS
jgi:hypothetical protein